MQGGLTKPAASPEAVSPSSSYGGPPPNQRGFDPGWSFRYLLVAAILLLLGLTLIPIIKVLSGGSLFGGDWAEYLLSGPAYLHETQGLYLYPYPVLPALYLPLNVLLGQGSIRLAFAADIISGLIISVLFVAAYFACSAHVSSRWGGLVGALVIASFPLYLYEVAWGGQAQLLAYILGLIALGILFRNGIPGRSFPLTVLAGGILAIGAATELYATSFVLTFVGLMFLTKLTTRTKRAGVIVSMVETLSLPALVVIGVMFTNPAFTNAAGEPALWHYWSYGPIWTHLWTDLSFQTSILAEAYAGILLFYAAYRLVYRSPVSVRSWVVPLLGISAVAVGLLFTPGEVADRSLYPLAFPLGFAVAELATLWPRSSPPVAPRRLWRLEPEEVSWTLPVLVIASVSISGLQLGADTQLYPGFIAGYAFDQGELSQLSWLASEQGGVIYDSPNPHVFQVQWATDRPLFPGPAYQPYLLTSENKQETSVVGTELSYGPRWFDDGSLAVTDDEPEWGQPAPGILMFQGAHLYMTIEGDDFLNQVQYSPGSSPAQTSVSSLFYAPSVSTSATSTVTSVYYNWTDLSAVRTVQVLSSGPILLNYTFDFASSIPRSISLYLTSPGRTPTQGEVLSNTTTCSNSTVSQSYPAAWIPSIPISFGVGACASGAMLTTKYVSADQFGIFQLKYNLVPANSSVRVLGLSMEIRPDVPGSDHPKLVLQGAALAANDIDWVVLERTSSQLLIQRFMDDSAYSLYRTTPDYYILAAR